MARSSLRPIAQLPDLSQQPGIQVEPLPLWQPPKGLNYFDPLTKIGREYAPQITNFWIDRGIQRSRYGTTDVSSGIANLMAVLNFIDGNGIAFLLRFTTTKMQAYDGVVWYDIFTGFTGSTSDFFTFTAFGNNLILSNGVDGVYEYNFSTGILTKIDGAPACRQLTTFDGRILASNVIDPITGSRIGSRVVWSVKLNSKIWPDSSAEPGDTEEQTAQKKLGSGFEDMLNTPGGQIDQQRGVWPVTDTIALAVRSKSVWQVMVTGNFDAPFRFDRLYDNIGSDSPQSIDTVPGGIVGLFNDDIYVLSNTDIKAIGEKIRDQMLAETTVLANVSGMYDPATKNFWLANQSFVYRYSFNDQGWSRHQYPFVIRQMMRTKSSISGLTIDQLVGTIDGLAGTIDSLVGSTSVIGNFFATAGGTGYVIKEDSTVADDSNGAGGRTDSAVEIRTTGIQYGLALQRNRTLQTQLEYEAAATQTLVVEYSTDNGVTWIAYSTLALGITSGPDVKPFRHTIDARLFQLRIKSTKLGKLKIIGLWAFGQKGALVNL